MGEINTTPEPESKFARDAKSTMCGAALLISSFKWKLAKAGYPFTEPPGVDAILRDIDVLCFPEENKKQGKVKAAA
jgi:hypothetical protein